MAKIENTKMTVSLDNESKRVLRNLSKAIDRLSRNMRPFEVKPGDTGRLLEPAEDTPKSYVTGGYTRTGAKFAEPAPGHYISGNQVELDPAAVQNLAQSVLNQKSYLQ